MENTELLLSKKVFLQIIEAGISRIKLQEGIQ